MRNPDWYSWWNEWVLIQEYLQSFEVWLWLVNEAKEEIKTILNWYKKLWRWIWTFTQDELIEMLTQIDNWNNIEWYWIATQLMDNWLLDSVYVRCIYCFTLYENQLCDEKLRSGIINNPEVLKKFSEQVQIRIHKILEGE